MKSLLVTLLLACFALVVSGVTPSSSVTASPVSNSRTPTQSVSKSSPAGPLLRLAVNVTPLVVERFRTQLSVALGVSFNAVVVETSTRQDQRGLWETRASSCFSNDAHTLEVRFLATSTFTGVSKTGDQLTADLELLVSAGDFLVSVDAVCIYSVTRLEGSEANKVTLNRAASSTSTTGTLYSPYPVVDTSSLYSNAYYSTVVGLAVTLSVFGCATTILIVACVVYRRRYYYAAANTRPFNKLAEPAAVASRRDDSFYSSEEHSAQTRDSAGTGGYNSAYKYDEGYFGGADVPGVGASDVAARASLDGVRLDSGEYDPGSASDDERQTDSGGGRGRRKGRRANNG